jgi:hypothetical protein
VQLAPEFWTLVESLEDMSRRWTARQFDDDTQSTSLFAQFAARLRRLHYRCEKYPRFKIKIEGSPFEVLQEDEMDCRPGTHGDQSPFSTTTSSTEAHDHIPGPATVGTGLPQQGSMASSPGVGRIHVRPSAFSSQVDDGAQGNAEDDISALSLFLTGQPFMDMDRIISFDDMMFTGVENGPASGSANVWIATNQNLQ